MFRSYLVLIKDYYLSLKENIYFDIVLPVLIAGTIGFFLWRGDFVFTEDIVNNIVQTLGVLAGFSLTAVSMLTTTDSKTTTKLKQKLTGNIIRDEDISAFRQFYILVSYSILISLIVIVLNSIAIMIDWNRFVGKSLIVNTLKAIDIFLILHIFLVNIRNITYLYFIYYDETNSTDQTKNNP